MYNNKVEICGVDTSKLPVMKEKDKERLLKEVKSGNKSARDELINGNLRLVLSVVQRFSNRGENPDDLFQVGCIGLIKAIDNFDITQPVKFSTYAVPMRCTLGKKERNGHFKMAENRIKSRVSGTLLTVEYDSNDLCKGQKNDQVQQKKTRNSKWTDKTIREAIIRFIDEFGRPPKVKELDKYDWLPPHPSIKNRYNKQAGKWLLENYPPKRVNWKYSYEHYTPNDFRNMFIEEYTRLLPNSKLDYNKFRNQTTPSWQYIAKMLGVNTWVELKELCGVKTPRKRKGEHSFTVVSHILGVSEDVNKRSPYKR